MRRIAMEEAFWLDELSTHGSPVGSVSWMRSDVARHWARRLTDFTDYRLPEMDRYGIDVQVLSLTSPGLQLQPDARIATDDARLANDLLADRIAAHPGRFEGLAALALQDPSAAAGELRRAVRDLGLRGALVNDHTLGRYLDEPQFEPVWNELESLDVPLYLHPGAVPADRWRVFAGYPMLAGPSFGWCAATGGHLLRLICGRVFDRHPGAKVILGHMGEFLPFQLARLDVRHADLDLDEPTDRLPSQYICSNVTAPKSPTATPSAYCGCPALKGQKAISAGRPTSHLYLLPYIKSCAFIM